MYREYFEFISAITIKYAKDYNCRLTITGNRDLMNHLAQDYNNEENIWFQCLNNEAFQRKLHSTEVFITTCGIEATYEAFGSRTPTIFLPPVNSTQLHQLMALIALNFPVIVSKNLISNFNKVIASRFEYHVETKVIATALADTINLRPEKIELENYLRSCINNIKLSVDFRNSLLRKQDIFFDQAPNKWSEVLDKTLAA